MIYINVNIIIIKINQIEINNIFLIPTILVLFNKLDIGMATGGHPHPIFVPIIQVFSHLRS